MTYYRLIFLMGNGGATRYEQEKIFAFKWEVEQFIKHYELKDTEYKLFYVVEEQLH